MATVTDELIVRLTAVNDQFNRAMDNSRSSLDVFQKSAQSTSDQLNQVSNKFGISLAAMTGAAVGFVKTSGEFEQWGIAFETMIGSGDKAKKLMDDLINFAAKTPFNASQVVNFAKELMAMGVDVDNILPTMESLGNIASGLGRDTFPQLVLALGQVKAAGYLTGEELRQFRQAGVPIFAELQKVLKLSNEELNDAISKRQVSFDAVNAALENLSSGNGKFVNLMEKQNKSILGQWSNFQDNFVQVLKKIGDSLSSDNGEIIHYLIDITQKIRDMDPSTIYAIAKAFEVLTAVIATLFITTKAAALVSGLVTALTSLDLVLTGLTGAIAGVSAGISYASLPLLLNPITLAVTAAAAAFGAWMYNMRESRDELEKFKAANGDDKPFKASSAGLAQINKDIDDMKTKLKDAEKNLTDYKSNLLVKYGVMASAEYEKDLQQKVNGYKTELNNLEDLKKKQEAANNSISASKEKSVKKNIQLIGEDKEAEKQAVEFKLSFLKDEFKNREQLTENYYSFQAEKIAGALDKEHGHAQEIKKIVGDILQNKKDMTDKSYSLQIAALDNVLKAEGYNKDSILAIDKATLNQKKENLLKAENDYKKYLDDSYKAGIEMATNFEKGLSDFLKNTLFNTDTGFLKDLRKSLEPEMGGIGSLFAGAIDGLTGVFSGLIGVGVQNIITGLFGNYKYRNVMEYVQEAFQKMVDNTNKKLDDIGRQKTDIEKKVDVLNLLKTQYGEASAIPEQYKSALGLSGNMTVGEALQSMFKQIQGLNDQEITIRKDELDSLKSLQKSFDKFSGNDVHGGAGQLSGLGIQDLLTLLIKSGTDAGRMSEVQQYTSGFSTVGEALSKSSSASRLKIILDEKTPELIAFKIAAQQRIDQLTQDLSNGSPFSVDEALQNLQLISRINELTTPAPKYAVGAYEIPNAILHPGEAVFTKSIMDAVREGKLTISGPSDLPGPSQTDNRTINVSILGGTKSGAQIYQEIAPYLESSIRKRNLGAYQGIFRG